MEGNVERYNKGDVFSFIYVVDWIWRVGSGAHDDGSGGSMMRLV